SKQDGRVLERGINLQAALKLPLSLGVLAEHVGAQPDAECDVRAARRQLRCRSEGRQRVGKAPLLDRLRPGVGQPDRLRRRGLCGETGPTGEDDSENKSGRGDFTDQPGPSLPPAYSSSAW